MTNSENIKYKKLIDTGRELFFKYGTKRVTIEEICQKSGVSKMTYYKYFSNKRDLVIKILDDLIDDGMKKYNAIIYQKIPFMEKVKSVIELKMELASEYSEAFVEEAGRNDSYISKYLYSKAEERLKTIEEMYEMGIKEGEIDPKFSREFFIFIFYKVPELFYDETMIKLYPDMEERHSVVMNLFFFGLMGKSE